MDKERKKPVEKPVEKPAVVIDAKFLRFVHIEAEDTDCLIRISTADIGRLKAAHTIVIVVEQ